jgi:hypothetical protein
MKITATANLPPATLKHVIAKLFKNVLKLPATQIPQHFGSLLGSMHAAGPFDIVETT